jgi:lysophospholipase L1-like esterase
MPTRFHLKFLLLLATTVLALAIGEIGVRIAGVAPGFGVVRFGQRAASDDSILGWMNAANADGINSLGLRGAELRDPKSARRILVLGDSVAFGFGLESDQSIPAQLERELDARGIAAEVLNAGVIAYNTRQEGRWLELHGAALAPDEVIVIYCLNDTTDLGGTALPEDLVREAHKHAQREDWARSRDRARLSTFQRALLEHCHLARIVYYAATRPPPLQVAGAARASKEWSKDFWVVEDGFARIAKFCTAAGIAVRVVIMPWLDDLERYPHSKQHQVVAEIATRHRLPVLDLLPAYLEHHKLGGGEVALPGDPVHPNPEGVRVAAKAIAAAIAQ